jgi:hypothetical protein
VTPDLVAFAELAARMSPAQVLATRERKIYEIASLEASIAKRQRDFPMHKADYDILRDQRRCAQLRREVDYLATVRRS